MRTVEMQRFVHYYHHPIPTQRTHITGAIWEMLAPGTYTRNSEKHLSKEMIHETVRKWFVKGKILLDQGCQMSAALRSSLFSS